MLENTSNCIQPGIAHGNPPEVNVDAIGGLVSNFASVTSGLVDLIDCGRFANDLAIWAGRSQKPGDVASAVNYLVLAIGSQTDAPDLAAEYFHYAKTLALASLDGNLGVDTVKAFALITLSWLFASAIVTGVGLLGGFGRVLEKYARMAISALEFFAKEDTHAMQYSLIAKSLLTSALQYLEMQETKERIRTAESSSQLFGLIPKEDTLSQVSVPVGTTRDLRPSTSGAGEVGSTCISPASRAADSMFGEIDTSIFSLNDPLAPPSEFSHLARNPQDQVDQVFGALNLFPLLDGNGHIDLAHYL
ncbi:hypothetical protein DL766_007956 [Monosporascus sp. MC13-8B]|uniref:Fungal STAND N-terminal Goodbye domain-containing protein n=1 Tax=Monosporascus cannonballus TaxID=155416 RepID=A0ABY0HJ53_9PEZI|nr:hypothetical protein DL762_000428 [Monosporascus cannonballus]RYP01135.1 hypothetical protein DL763_000372 [Monosporascus cannonballus]RYP21306.1 hypothetical protein DL766_007956 [Monosporascus sp. MC13-8B]